MLLGIPLALRCFKKAKQLLPWRRQSLGVRSHSLWCDPFAGMEGSIMGQVRHGSATTTHAVRAAIQRSQASLATLSRELGINPKTVAKWHKRATVDDLKTGPKEPRSHG